ncbi:sensor histidine kinase [Microbacterium sp.]|uniref:sensor histidine kinase n=1 Tax=Microbacterium sp. TaxID=51671 RepID=UPI0039E570A4
MSRSGTVGWAIASAVPVGVCALAAGAMLFAGEDRMLVATATLPGVVFGVGVVASAIPLSILVDRRRAARRREAEAKAIAAATDAARADERAHHQRFLAQLDHELKNPITAIRATAVSAQDGEHAEAQADAWRTVDAQSMKLSTLVRDLRKLAELETRPLEFERIDIEQLLAESIAALAQQNPGAGARIALTVTRVPWAVPPLTVDIDLISLVFDNVLGNAAKYSTDGPIEVRLREQEGWALIEVADAGRGIPVDDQPHVFDELARAQNARDVSGSGLGLTLVATVMRRHGGDVALRSVEDAGTQVTLRLPIPR